jgi:hypothetical protein
MPKAGPYSFLEKVGTSNPYRTYLITHKVTTDTHVSNLCEFRYDSSSNMNPFEVAASNAGKFFVDRISDHRGLALRRTSMEVLVSWKCYYSTKDDTCEPYKAFCKTQAFVDYFLTNRLTPLVNKALRGSRPTGLQL